MTGGVIWSVLSAMLAIAPATDAFQAPQPQGPARFRSAVDIVSVAAVVRDRKGRFVSDLSREDFQVVESGARRRILDFRADTEGPVKLALLVDISGSMRVGAKAVDARQAAAHVFSGLRGADEAAVFAFDTQVDQLTPFTSNRAELEAGFDKAGKPYGQTSLYDAIVLTSRAVAAATRGGGSGPPHRSAVVVVTDGIDTRSRITPAQVAAIASGMDVPVYIVAVMSTIDDPRNRDEDDDVTVGDVTPTLQELARWTGGELFTASAPAHASVAARQILSELRHQYILAFEATPGAGWRPLEVRAREGLVVRARSGYGGGTE